MLQGRSQTETRKGLQSLFLRTNKHKAMIELIILQLLFNSQVIKIQHNSTPCYAQIHANPAWRVCRPLNLLEYRVWDVEPRNLQSHGIDRTPRIRRNNVDLQIEIDALYSSVEKADWIILLAVALPYGT